jgi:hypothetical protein
MQDARVPLAVPFAGRLFDLFAAKRVNSGLCRVDGEITGAVRASFDPFPAGEVGRDLGGNLHLTLPEDAHGQSRLASRGAQLERQSLVDGRDDPPIVRMGRIHPRVVHHQDRLAAAHLDAVGMHETIRTKRLTRPGDGGEHVFRPDGKQRQEQNQHPGPHQDLPRSVLDRVGS